MLLVASAVAFISYVFGRVTLSVGPAIVDHKPVLEEWRDSHEWGVYMAAIGGAIALLRSRSSTPVDLLEFRWPGLWPFLFSSVKWAVIGVAFGGAAGGVACGSAMGSFIDAARIFTIPALISFGITGGISALLQARVAGARSAPEVVLSRSLHSALICAAGSSFISLAVLWLSYDWLSGFDSVQAGIAYMPWVGIFVALEKGGYFLLNHYATRLLLRLRHLIPWNIVRFLDAAAERIFLRKVGGGYIFVHRTLLEYFAGLRAPAE